jgi:hypothetical protein
MEAAKAFHYSWAEWQRENPLTRAKLVAHELCKGMRDTYNFEQRMEAGKHESPRGPAPWDAIRERFFK